MSVSTYRKQLYNHPPQSRATMSAWPAIIFSLPFTAVGLFIIAISYNIIPVDDSKFHAPRNLVALCGALFFIAGEIVFFQGILDLIRRQNTKKHAQDFPGSAAMSDFAWDRGGIKGEGLGQVITNFLGWGFFSLFLIPFHWIFLTIDKKVPFFVYFVIGLFDLIVLFGLGYCIYLLIRYLRYGQSFLKFNRFPYSLGGPLEATVIMAKPLKGVTKLKTTLRFVEEQIEVRGTGKNRTVQVVCYELYNETNEKNDFMQYSPDIERLPVMLNLPDNPDLKNNLSLRPPRYWQLEVSAATPGVDYLSRFLIPVY